MMAPMTMWVSSLEIGDGAPRAVSLFYPFGRRGAP
jgi:hypothetical protein